MSAAVNHRFVSCWRTHRMSARSLHMGNTPHEPIRFADFELNPASFALLHAGRPVKLERIPLQLLFLLAEKRDRLVSREEILAAIWGKDVFVDADNSINTAVRKVRQALKDDPENPRYLRTIPGKGYRFTAAVNTDHIAVTVSPVPLAPITPAILDNARDSATPKNAWPALLAAVALIALVTTGFLVRSRFTSSPQALPKKSLLVVLPFLNLSGDSGEDYFADGMTEEMITQLGSLDPQHLGVIARTSSMQYRGTQKGAAQVARELGVDYLLEGSIRRAGPRVRVSAQLIQASDQTHLWAADFDRDLSDVLKLQRDLALAIAANISLNLPSSMRSRPRETSSLNASAYEAYLRGLHDWDLRTRPAVERALSEFQQAIDADPNYAPAYAALARAYSLASMVGAMIPVESMPKAREAAERAITLDPSLAAGHTVMGFVLAHYDFDWRGAEREYLRALDLNPNDSYAHLFYSNSYLSPRGLHADALREMQKAIAADPYSAPVQSFLGRTYIWARQYDQAIAQFRKCNELFPGFALSHERLAQLLAHLGKFDEAITEDTKARMLTGETENSARRKETALRNAWTAGGAPGYWKQLLDLMQLPGNPPEAYNSPFGIAILHSQLGERSKALDALEKAFDQRSLSMTELAVEPAFDSIRSEPRFQALLRRVGLEVTNEKH
jgi:TolB-like protein/DNA-binding winged helix-turn-helix (wHTH) protein/Tfp pilus assembly protein PilF